VNYKRDLKQIDERFYLDRKKVLDANRIYQESLGGAVEENSSAHVCFKLKVNESETRSLRVNHEMLTKRSEYFNAMLSGRFMENASKNEMIELGDVPYELFAIIIKLLEFDSNVNSEEKGLVDSIDLNSKLTFESCVELVMLCDRFFLQELKEFFISTLLSKFLSISTWFVCFKLAWFLNNQYIANACIDFLLAQIIQYPINKENGDDGLIQFKDVFEILLNNLKSLDFSNSCTSASSSSSILNENEKQPFEMLRKTLKMALSEIIKNNNWKF
jgi:hypothetical protein